MNVTRPLRDAGNEGNPNKIGSFAQIAKLGDALAGGQRYARAAVASNVLELPDASKALVLLGGWIITATGSVGPLQVVPADATLAAGQAKISPTGDILFFGTDAVLAAEVYYLSAEQQPVTVDIVVVPGTGIGSLVPRAGLILLSAEALTGGVTGAATVLQRGATVATTEAALTANGESVAFLIADAVTSARVTYVPQPGFGPTPESVATKMDADANL